MLRSLAAQLTNAWMCFGWLNMVKPPARLRMRERSGHQLHCQGRLFTSGALMVGDVGEMISHRMVGENTALMPMLGRNLVPFPDRKLMLVTPPKLMLQVAAIESSVVKEAPTAHNFSQKTWDATRGKWMKMDGNGVWGPDMPIKSCRTWGKP